MYHFLPYPQFRYPMKKILLLLFMGISCLVACAQMDLRFYDIRGNRVSLPDSVQPVIICYHTGCCHNCMNILVSYAQDLVRKNSNLKLFVLVPGGDVGTMRFLTSGLKDYFNEETLPTVLYDLDPTDSERYLNRYDVQKYPCMIVFDSMRQCHYLSYDVLWENSDSLNTDVVTNIIDNRATRKKRTRKGPPKND